MAGQSVDFVTKIMPVADIIAELVTDAGKELERVAALL
jgi:hypothetical protein